MELSFSGLVGNWTDPTSKQPGITQPQACLPVVDVVSLDAFYHMKMSDLELRLLGFNALPQFTQVGQFEEHLERFLGSGALVFWENGEPVLGFGRAQVDRVHGLRIEIRSREHAPPHFHVVAPGVNASFSIADGSLIAGSIGHRQKDLVRFWYHQAKVELIRVWNESRPADCPVGRVASE